MKSNPLLIPAWVGLFGLMPFAEATSPQPPNFVLILVDDLGWKDVGFMGNPWVRTPNIDRLSREGMTFTDAYSGGPNCAPSRACLMSGRYTPRHGVYTVGQSDRGDAEQQRQQRLVPVPNRPDLAASFFTLPEALQAQSYTTVHIGKWHLGGEPGVDPESQGFDLNFGGDHNGQPPQGYFAPYGLPNLEDAPPHEYLTDRLTDEACKFLQAPHTKPFFLYLAHYAVHSPIQAPAGDVKACKERLPADAAVGATYAAMIESVDRSVGRVMADLERLGLAENTVVLLLSDNGGVSGRGLMKPLRGAKGMLYEGGIRVPFVIRWPGRIPAGGSCAEPVTSVDLYPTLLQLASGSPRADVPLDGQSLLPLWQRAGDFGREAIFWHFPAYLPGEAGRHLPGARDDWFRTRPCGVVRSGDWKLIEYFEDGAVELFNLRQDIAEEHDLAATEPVVRDRLPPSPTLAIGPTTSDLGSSPAISIRRPLRHSGVTTMQRNDRSGYVMIRDTGVIPRFNGLLVSKSNSLRIGRVPRPTTEEEGRRSQMPHLIHRHQTIGLMVTD
jgi:arylsulfatase A-like enzyme